VYQEIEYFIHKTIFIGRLTSNLIGEEAKTVDEQILKAQD
jgi:hypothetical protein